MGSQGTGIGGANMWALLLDKDPGHSAGAGDLAVDVVDRKLKKAGVTPVDVVDRKLKKVGVTPVNVVDRKLSKKAGVTPVGGEVAKAARRGQMVKKEKLGASGDYKQAPASGNGREVQINVSAESKLAVATAIVSDGDALTNNREEIKEVLAALRRIEEGEAAKAKEEMFDVVPARRGRRRREATPTIKDAIVAEGVTAVTGSNMWALLSNNDPGHGSAKPAKQGKKNNTKKNAAGANKQVETVDDDEEKETPAPAPSELEEKLSEEEEEEEEMTGEAATVGSRCLTVASGVFQAAIMAVGMLALYFELTLPSPA